jgi:hypothetical protein
MYARRLTVSVTTDASGDVTAYSDFIESGFLSQIRYVKTDFDNTADFTITLEATGETLWAENNVAASATRAPRQATHGTDGTASLFAAAGSAVQDKIAIAGSKIKIVVAQGGNVKSGTFHFILG